MEILGVPLLTGNCYTFVVLRAHNHATHIITLVRPLPALQHTAATLSGFVIKYKQCPHKTRVLA